MEGGGPSEGGAAGGSPGGFHNIDALPLGNLLQVKQTGKAKKKTNVRKLMEQGFK